MIQLKLLQDSFILTNINLKVFTGLISTENQCKLSLVEIIVNLILHLDWSNVAACLLAGTSIYAIDFSFIEPQQDDFVYFDPPYHKSGEKFYTRLPFDENEQTRLRDFALELNNKNVKIIISNSNTPFIRNLYKNFNIRIIKVKYSMAENNKTSEEVIVTNY